MPSLADPGTARARELVMSHGWNSSAYQILNPGIQHWYNARGTGVVGYAERGKYLLVAGDPVCAPETLSRITSEFEEFAKRERRRVCYVCAAEPLRKLLARSREHSIVTLGAQPIWDPGEWASIIAGRASLRAQLRRALNKGVRVEQMDAGAAAQSAELRGVLQQWLTSRPLLPLGFLTEPEILGGELGDRVVFVARHANRAVAYLVGSPVPARNGYLIEMLARSRQAPNGTSELLVDAAMRRFAREARTYVTMGLVALVRNAVMHNPLWLRNLMGFARAHANRLYNFRGLEHFRVKMFPAAWEESYLISKERRFSPRSLYAVGGGFSGMSPVRAICSGVLKIAARQIVAQ